MAIYKMKIGNKNINTYAKYDLKHLKDAAQKTNSTGTEIPYILTLQRSDFLFHKLDVDTTYKG